MTSSFRAFDVPVKLKDPSPLSILAFIIACSVANVSEVLMCINCIIF